MRRHSGVVRLDVPYTDAEKMGYHVFDYTLKYEINGFKFKRHFTSRRSAEQYVAVLTDNFIFPKLTVKRRTKRRVKP